MNQPSENKTCWTHYVAAEKLIRAQAKKNSKTKIFIFLLGLACGYLLSFIKIVF